MSIMEFNTKTLTDHILNTQKYQEESLNEFREIRKTLTDHINFAIKRFYSIKFPDTVTTIQSSDALAYITYMYATTPPTLSSISNKTGTNVQLIYVPNGCLEAYQGATNWSNYASKMVEMPA